MSQLEQIMALTLIVKDYSIIIAISENKHLVRIKNPHE